MAFRLGLLGKKIGMTQKFDASGTWVPMCAVQTGPCVVLEVKTPSNHGYSAVKLGFDEKRESRTSRPEAGVFRKAKTTPKGFVREIRLTEEQAAQFEVGQTVRVSQIFRPGDRVDVTGTSKGKGFQGVMKRHHFSGFRATHGTHEYFRHGGSIGCRLTPGRVHKGKRMPGQMGNKRATVQNVRVIEVLDEDNLLLLGGGLPGAPTGYLLLRQASKGPSRPLAPLAAEPQPEPVGLTEPPAPAEPAPEA